MTPELLTRKQFGMVVLRHIKNRGSARALGEEIGIGPDTLYDAVHGRFKSTKVAEALGYEAVVMYKPKEKRP